MGTHIWADRVKEISAESGAGSMTLGGVPDGQHRTFASVMSVGDTCDYFIETVNGIEWERGIGTLRASTTLERTVVKCNSNGNTSPVSFPAGTKYVALTYPGTATVASELYENETGTGTISDHITWKHNIRGTPPARFGTRWRHQLKSATAENRDAFWYEISWVTATDASRKARAIFNIYDTAAREAMRLEADGTAARVGIGGAVDTTALLMVQGVGKYAVNDAVTAAVTNVLFVDHNSTGTPAAGFGGGVRFRLESTTTADQDAAAIDVSWATATHATRKARAVFNVYDTAAREALRLEADGTVARVGVGGAVDTTALLMVNGVEKIALADAVTNAVSQVLYIDHNTSGTAAAGFGSGERWRLESSTTADQDALAFDVSWATATHASRKARAVFNVYDTAAREAFRMEADGAAAKVAFGGAVDATEPAKFYGNVQFTQKIARQLCVDSGSTFPLAPVNGQWFLATHTGRFWVCIGRSSTFSLDVVDFDPLIGAGDTTVYIDQGSGTDAPDKGTSAGSNAYATITYALTRLPKFSMGNVQIYLSAHTYREEVTLTGLYCKGTITLTGTAAANNDSGTATSGANGAGLGRAGFGTLTRTGAGLTVNAHRGRFIETTGGTGSGQIYTVESNTATVYTICGRWDTVPDATTTYKVYEAGTIISGADSGTPTVPARATCVTVKQNQVRIQLNMLKLIYGAAFNLLVETAGEAIVNQVMVSNHTVWGIMARQRASLEMTNVSVMSATAGTSGDVGILDNAEFTVDRSLVFNAGTSTYGIYVNGGNVRLISETMVGNATLSAGPAASSLYFTGQGRAVIFDYAEFNGAASHGIHITDSSFCLFNDGTARASNNGGWGVLSAGAGRGPSASTISYSGNTSGTYSPTTDLAGGNT